MFLIRISSTYYQEKINAPTPEEAKSISENSIKDCLLCCELPCDGVLMPCGHSGICYQCAVKLLESNKPCYICRKPLKSVIQIISKENKVVLVTELDE